MGSSRKWLRLIGSRKQLSSADTAAASADGKPSRWKLWKFFGFTGKKFAYAGNKKGLGDTERTDVVCQERAAIHIQTAFRGFLAKRALRALKGLVCLQAAITGHDSRKQSGASLQCIKAFVRVQARFHRERAIQSRDALGLSQQKLVGSTVDTCTADSEMEWCNALGTFEEVRAKQQQKQVPAIKRDRAIAYAFCNKWKGNKKVNPGSLFDYEIDNSTWSWIWLDEWLNSQPMNESINGNQGSQRMTNTYSSTKELVMKNAPAGFRSYLNSKVSPDKSNEWKKALKREGSPGRVLKVRAGKGKGIKVLALKHKAKLQSGHSLNKSQQQASKDAKRTVAVPNHK